MLRNELRRLFTWTDHHRLLIARLTIAFVLTVIVDMIGTILTYAFEAGTTGGDIHSFGDAAFFSTVQLLTVSSQIRNPLTAGGRIVDVFLEIWAIIVVAGAAGSFAAFWSGAPEKRAP